MTTIEPKTSDPEECGATVLDERRCHLGEGANYDAASDTAWWFDILERQLFERHLASGVTIVHDLPFMASALAFIDDGRQLVAADDGLYVRSVAEGHLSLLAPLEADNAATRSNDGRAHPSGTFWIGTMGRRAEPGAGAIYALRNGGLTRLYAGLSIPNAICFSPDGMTGYFADSRPGVLYRVPLDPATGLPVGEPAEFHRAGGPGDPDGAVVDAEGLLWNARWGGGRVDVYTPAGERVRSLRVPARQPSCPVFVGRDFRRMLVTTAYQGLDEDAKAEDPHHGRTFVVDPGATGRAEARVRLA